MEHGINASLLRKWIQLYRGQVSSLSPSPAATLPAFAPVLSVTTPKWVEATVAVALPNGVKLELQSVSLTAPSTR